MRSNVYLQIPDDGLHGVSYIIMNMTLYNAVFVVLPEMKKYYLMIMIENVEK